MSEVTPRTEHRALLTGQRADARSISSIGLAVASAGVALHLGPNASVATRAASFLTTA